MREAEVERERQGETERVGGRFSQRGGSARGGEVMRPVTGFTPRLCGN